MDDLTSAQYRIPPKSMHKEYGDFQEALLDIEDFMDIAVNTVTDINGYCGVVSTKTVIDIDYSSRKAKTTVYVYMEKDRTTEASPYPLNVGCK